MSPITVTALYRYPVKGFSPEPVQRADIARNGTMPFDRAFAIENGPSGFEPAAPAYKPKRVFLMLMRDERMAEFSTRFDEASGLLAVRREGKLEIEASLEEAEGRRALEAWLAGTFREELRGPPKILSAAGHSFSDKKAKVLHLVNLASVRALAGKVGRDVDPLRFRPNIVIDGAPAFAELDWARETLDLPSLRLKGESRTGRCAATEVDPKTGARDMDVRGVLDSLLGHRDFGIYLVADAAGSIAVGDEVRISKQGHP